MKHDATTVLLTLTLSSALKNSLLGDPRARVTSWGHTNQCCFSTATNTGL